MIRLPFILNKYGNEDKIKFFSLHNRAFLNIIQHLMKNNIRATPPLYLWYLTILLTNILYTYIILING